MQIFSGTAALSLEYRVRDRCTNYMDDLWLVYLNVIDAKGGW